MNRTLIALLAGFLCCGFSHGGGTFPSQVNATADSIGATCNGTADDTSAWNTFVAANQGANVVLTIPAGRTCCFISTSVKLAKGITNLRVMGYGATITNFCNGTTGSPYFMGAGGDGGILQNNTTSALVQTVSAGASAVTLVTAAQNSRFTVGQWVLLTGFDIQAGAACFGYPPNPAFHDWALITAINAGTGVISFHDPLQSSYESTWPNFDPGSSICVNKGGPALLYALDPAWGGTVEWRGVTLSMKSGGTDANIDCRGRVCRLADVTISCASAGNFCGPIPSQNQYFAYQNVSNPLGFTEEDKIVDQVLKQNSTFRSTAYTSASINEELMTGTTYNNVHTGTAVKSTLSNSTVTGLLQYGATGYGTSLTVTQQNVTAGSTQSVGASQANIDSSCTMAGGVLTCPISLGALPWATPGRSATFSNGVATPQTFTIIDVSVSGMNQLVTTSLAGGFPFAGPITATAASPTVH